jgi:D-alanine--poly(phosphoribitol) ligase subunit 1
MYKFNFLNYFKDVVNHNKKKIGLIDIDDKKYTFNFLDHESDLLATHLEFYKNKHKIVAIESDKNVNTIISFLACLKVGLPYFFLDDNLPIKRVNDILKKTKCKLSISKKKISNLNHIDLKKLKKINKVSYTTCTSDNIAYVMFTSGSTGSPKGVMISHQSVINFVLWSKKNFNFKSNDVFSQLNPLYFDNSVFDLFNSMLHGNTLVLLPKLNIDNPNLLLKKIYQHKCTIWFSTPSLLIYFLNCELINSKKFIHIKKIIFGGEGFPKPKLEILFKKLKNKDFYNVYGPTECTCICSQYLINKKDFLKNSNKKNTYMPIGKIAENFDFKIVDKNFNEVKKGEIGELILFGPNVAHGYIGDRKVTEQHFIYDNDFKSQRGYKTGDLVKQNIFNDQLYFIGRNDTQIKHMGYRIELMELEVVLNKIKSVKESCVFYIKKENKEIGKLVTVIAIKQKLTKIEIIEFIKKYLPSYFMPQEIFLIKDLPKNSNGKINRTLIKDIYGKKIQF